MNMILTMKYAFNYQFRSGGNCSDGRSLMYAVDLNYTAPRGLSQVLVDLSIEKLRGELLLLTIYGVVTPSATPRTGGSS